MSLVFKQRTFLGYFILSKSNLLLPTHCRYSGLNLPLVTLVDAPYSVGLPCTTDWPSQRPDNTQHSQERDFYAPGGIRTLKPKKRAATDPRHEDAPSIKHKQTKKKAVLS
jgi:hypothetical protein